LKVYKLRNRKIEVKQKNIGNIKQNKDYNKHR